MVLEISIVGILSWDGVKGAMMLVMFCKQSGCVQFVQFHCSVCYSSIRILTKTDSGAKCLSSYTGSSIF